MTLKKLTSDHIKSRHGFYTRAGGISAGIYAGLNCGFGSQDEKKNVTENRRRVENDMGLNALYTVYQHHSSDVVVLEGAFDPATKADAMVSTQTGIGLGILTADCAPILFHDPKNNVIGAAHSGWKGAVLGITENVVGAMIKLGAERREICATIGPCISQKNYEVGQDFLEEFMDADPINSQFFINGAAGKYHFDLPSFCLAALRKEEIKSADWVGACTYNDEAHYYSYRRSTHRKEPDYGRLISVIAQ
ncbi:MAG: peptidoglycan editing factor PgeF [Pseudomonadota bacterium]